MKNRGMEAQIAEMMAQRIPEELQDMAISIGLPPDTTLAVFADHMRVATRRVEAGDLAIFIESFKGWDVYLEMDPQEIVVHGDHIGAIQVAGALVPAYVHMGLTEMFDRTDPPLEKLFASAAEIHPKAMVLNAVPHFFLDVGEDESIRSVLFQGGWFLDGGSWSPFLFTDKGPDDIPAQRGMLKSGSPSKELLRDRGVDAIKLDEARILFESMHNSISEIFGDELGPIAERARADEDSVQLVSSEHGWSSFTSERGRDVQMKLMESLQTPRPAAPPSDPMENLQSFLKGAPAPIADVVEQMTNTGGEAEYLLSHIAHLTNGFEGLDDNICKDVTPQELSSLISCSTSQISAPELSWWFDAAFQWDMESVNPGHDPPEGGEIMGAGLVGHGDIISFVHFESFDEPVPVVFHGGEIDPTESFDNFAFLAMRRSLMARFDGGPVLVMPAMFAFRGADGMPAIAKGVASDRLVIMAGYAYDGEEWYPVSLGEPGTDPFDNRLYGADLLPEDDEGYTGTISMLMPWAGEPNAKQPTEDVEAMRLTFMMQMVLDRHHNLGPEIALPRKINPSQDYRMLQFNDDWFGLVDVKRDEIYPRLV